MSLLHAIDKIDRSWTNGGLTLFRTSYSMLAHHNAAC